MGKKKAKKGDPSFDDDFPDTESSVVPDTKQSDTASQQKPAAKKTKAKKGKRGGADWESDEEDQKAPAPASPPPAKRAGPTPKATSTFAALDPEHEAESDASSDRCKLAATAFAALDGEEQEETVDAAPGDSDQVQASFAMQSSGTSFKCCG